MVNKVDKSVDLWDLSYKHAHPETTRYHRLWKQKSQRWHKMVYSGPTPKDNLQRVLQSLQMSQKRWTHTHKRTTCNEERTSPTLATKLPGPYKSTILKESLHPGGSWGTKIREAANRVLRKDRARNNPTISQWFSLETSRAITHTSQSSPK